MGDDRRLIRLQVALAKSGVASRRKAEAMIREGRVSVNGQVVREMGAKVRPGEDRLAVDGRPVEAKERLRYYLLNKPRGIITSVSDPRGRKTVGDLVQHLPERLYPVGRLDRDSEGLLLMTNDGELTHHLTHPSGEVPKRYRVTVSGAVKEADLSAIAEGLDMPGLRTGPVEVGQVSQQGDRTRLTLVLREGQNRQIRRSFEALGYRVLRLRRLSIGPLSDPSLKPGELRPLTAAELRSLGVGRHG